MIKKLFFMAALLVPGLAYGGNPSADLLVQIVPAGSPPVPAAAQAAGFTTLAANYDFSQPAYADPNTNWLDCNDNDNTKIWHAGSPGVPSLDCNIHQKVDSLDGSTVLNVHLDISHACDTNGIAYPFCSVSLETRNETGKISTASYPNKYYETVARVTGSFADTRYNSPQGVWEWWSEVTPGSGEGGIEGDNVEFQYDSSGYGNDGWHNWGGGTSSSAWASYNPGFFTANPGWTPTAYHKYGMLTTSDGATSIWMCWFIDDVLQGSCQSVSSIQTIEYVQRKFLIMTSYAAGGSVPMISSRDLNVKNIRIWSCSTWQGNPGDASHMCNGSTLLNNGTLAYWR